MIMMGHFWLVKLILCYSIVDFGRRWPTSAIAQSNHDDLFLIEVSWTKQEYVVQTVPSLQIVTNPLVSREFSPISQEIFANLKQLQAEYARYAVWFPYPKLAVAELDPPSGIFQCRNVGENYSIDLSCAQHDGVISRINFASYGTATGACGNMKQGTCHSVNSLDIVQGMCLGQTTCRVLANNDLFGDPCELSSIEHCVNKILLHRIHRRT
jgi:hypothetical protein